jgi:truncated hemoglobin YjbI/ankyrin repeat protein
MEHRRFLAHPEVHRPFVGSNLFARIGGRAVVEVLVDGLYDRIENDAALAPLFSRDLTRERKALSRFFAEWLGGESSYSSTTHLPLKHRHDLLPITRVLADKWLAHFRDALNIAVADVDARRVIYEKVRALGLGLVNESDPRTALRARSHGTCLRYKPAVASIELARRGDANALRALLAHAPDILASTPHAAKLLQLAVLAGRTPVVELLLDKGVDVNKPSPLALAPSRDFETLIFATPLCAARLKRRKDIEIVLISRGAKEDVFTHAFLGELSALEEDLAHVASAAQASDPAVDALEITPIHHAVAGGDVEALRVLLARVTDAKEPLRGANRAIRIAVAHENASIVAMLLEHGADATTVRAGRWVVHPELAPMLARAGARVDRTGAWIQLSCTGNQGRKDDPAYVAALLRHGARVDDRRETVQMSDGGRATALHYAAKAGFVKTIEILLDHGADPEARDDNGRTPLDWLARASKSVDLEAVRRLLHRPRARSVRRDRGQ